MDEPRWFEVTWEAHGAWEGSDGYPDMARAAVGAEQLLEVFRDDMDVASWTISLLPHWCEMQRGECNCDDLRERETYASFKGVVSPW